MNVLIISYSTLFMVDTSSLVPVLSLNDLKTKYTKGMSCVINGNVKLTFATCKWNILFQTLSMPYMYYWATYSGVHIVISIENNFIGSECEQFV